MGFVRDLTGKTAVDAAGKAADAQVLGGQEASALFDPFKGIGQQGLAQSEFLTDPNAQFDFLQNNPLFQMGLDNANTQTMQSAAARGRLSSGDTLQQLNNNALLAASPLIQDQKQSIGDLINFGLTTAGNQGNLRTGQAAAEAGGIVGSANARGASAQGIVNLGAQLGGMFASDPQLKENITKTGSENGHNTYSWTWNDKANDVGLFGESQGVMADEVKLKTPEAVTTNPETGYMLVNYSMIGVKH
jgi:hypothetical protein